jgi:hypothetical protein
MALGPVYYQYDANLLYKTYSTYGPRYSIIYYQTRAARYSYYYALHDMGYMGAVIWYYKTLEYAYYVYAY